MLYPVIQPLFLLWIGVVALLFAVMQPRRAVLVAFVGGWLFLPNAEVEIRSLPDVIPKLDRFATTAFGIMIGVVCFDAKRLGTLRLSVLDLPMVIFCVSIIPTSLSNGLGLYNGLAACFDLAIDWLVPYFVGRLYFRDMASVRELAIAIVIGGLIYVPLCWWEMRMSPQLHIALYGLGRKFGNLQRYGFWRPVVFLYSPLAVGMWLATATVCGVWLAGSGSVRRLGGYSLWWAVAAIGLTTVASRTVGAILLMIIGAGLFPIVRLQKSLWLLVALLLLVGSYPALRVAGVLPREKVTAVLASVFDENRVASMDFRMRHEDELAAKAQQRPWLGWGGYGRARVQTSKGGDASVTDGLWIILLGNRGWIGLLSLTAAFLVPPLLFCTRVPARLAVQEYASPGAALSVLLVVFWADKLPNAFLNPTIVVAMGALNSLVVRLSPAARRSLRRQAAVGAVRPGPRVGAPAER